MEGTQVQSSGGQYRGIARARSASCFEVGRPSMCVQGTLPDVSMYLHWEVPAPWPCPHPPAPAPRPRPHTLLLFLMLAEYKACALRQNLHTVWLPLNASSCSERACLFHNQSCWSL